ncbi:peptide/nickel transport system substrate-binding protein [Aureimonas altamirensis DSM 21988]|uniref:Peptide/nickel transport system substrate-binding protein n=1 Tax=Aureimonas altamirensis DSM 21988 TaxID=1121026 RepID=A0ABY1I6L2_9HYPH|nr:extracellular solute-binding protein [Aureimonas altamirensis]SHI69868.1 peptide/nickel transport system substrate-binding protein [Aureimonas altamirensis DSM 21988]
MPLASKALHAAALAACLLLSLVGTATAGTASSHAIAMHGEPALAGGFSAFPFVRQDAPKGGRMVYGVVGDFDNLNPVTVRGALTTARGIFADTEFGNLVIEPLMLRSPDEPFTLYGLIAESVETDAERSFVEFTLNPKATFSDGRPVRVADVLFTVDMLKQQGVVRPQYTNWLSRVSRIDTVGERGIRFTFNEKADRELPLLLAGLPVLPEHGFTRDGFGSTTLKPIVGSGPYMIASVQPGQRIVYRRNPDYWAADLPAKRGMDNYDEIVVEYFRDSNSQFEAFKKGLFYLYPDANPRHWRTAYNFPAVHDGSVVREVFETGRPAVLNAMFFNTRRQTFENPRVRQALSMLFDFEWANANLYYGAYERTSGFFDNTALSSLGRPASDGERAFLAQYPGRVDDSILAGEWRQPVTDGSGSDRRILREALSLLEAEGYRFDGSRLVDSTGRPLAFEILVQTLEQQRAALGYQRTLARIGVDIGVRQADDAQYQLRKQSFDYDVLFSAFNGTLSPGAEQVGRWGSAARDAQGSFNYSGVADPAVDAAIDAIVQARTREDYTDAVRAYDRILISGFYVVPLYYLTDQWLARWSFIHHPDRTPLTGYYLPSFWRESDGS